MTSILKNSALMRGAAMIGGARINASGDGCGAQYTEVREAIR